MLIKEILPSKCPPLKHDNILPARSTPLFWQFVHLRQFAGNPAGCSGWILPYFRQMKNLLWRLTENKDLSITALKPKSSAISVQLHPTGECQIHYIFHLESCSLVLFVHSFCKYLTAHITSLLPNSNLHFVRLTTLTAMSTTLSSRSELADHYLHKAS